MAYSVRCYKNTGFNAYNLPDTPALLDGMEFTDFDPIDILQNRAIQSITIRATVEQTQNIDYVRVGDMYYTCVPSQTSRDVCVLSLELDALLSMGGVNGLTILDGITERHHTGTDGFGEYREPDEMLTPNRPLEIVSGGILEPTGGDTDRVLIQATVNLYRQGQEGGATVYTGTDEAGETINVSVPRIISPLTLYHQKYTDAQITVPGISEAKKTSMPGTIIWDGTNEDVQTGVSRCRALGIESAILNQYVIPSGYGSGVPGDDGGYDLILGGSSAAGAELATGLPYEYANVKNKRLLYGENNDYVILSPASGNSATFCPEDIYYTGEAAPSVAWFADPRPEGKPYYRFKYYRGSSANFLENCIPGLTWQNAPLVYQSKSGSEVDTVKWETDQTYIKKMADINVQETQRQIGQQAIKTAGELAGHGLSLWLPGIAETGYGAADFATGVARQYTGYQRAGVENIMNFGYEQSVVAPQINFPRSEGIRDYIGNGVMVYRLRYHDVDLQRLDKKLTMYGYRATDCMEQSFFTNRQYFNFVKCSSITFGGNYPMYIRDAAGAQLSRGVRIWHVKPNPTYYTNGNPIKS